VSNQKYTNDFLEHYTKNKISPVRQNISSLEKHFEIRKSLYRTLGILPDTFKGKRIVEIGPGSGYNSLYIASQEPKELVLVEPNPTGVLHIENLFIEYKMDSPNISIKNLVLEEYNSSNLFDIVICEGLLPGIRDKKEFLLKLSSLLKPEGVLVITTADEISMFYETIRYFLAQKLTAEISIFEDKIKLLVEAFGSHLDSLKGFGRLKEDWCADSLLGNAIYNYDISIKDSIDILSDNHYFYGSSPSVLVDYTWFKEQDLNPKDFNRKYSEQFVKIHHNFFHYQVIAQERTVDQNSMLEKHCIDFLRAMKNHFQEGDSEMKIHDELNNIYRNLKGLSPKIDDSLLGLLEMIANNEYTVENISKKYPAFISSFGRGQQYVSFVKVKNNL
jgi:2-polyprenyl-3-methyl-5-hydroxy-6-metoxy-1,4-benzoquinol methylase